ncbi:hypothetical protein F4801DRAFT_568223 [Xylaria longipes]|nr:hypothetical protein F4801DRAFT_568223 [Xylaria longipes]
MTKCGENDCPSVADEMCCPWGFACAELEDGTPLCNMLEDQSRQPDREASTSMSSTTTTTSETLTSSMSTLETMVSVPTTDSPSWASSAWITPVPYPLTTGTEVPLSIQPASTPGAGNTTEGPGPNSDSGSTGTHLGVRAIAGIAAGAFVLDGICACLIWRWIRNKRKRRSERKPEPSPSFMTPIANQYPTRPPPIAQPRAQRPKWVIGLPLSPSNVLDVNENVIASLNRSRLLLILHLQLVPHVDGPSWYALEFKDCIHT